MAKDWIIGETYSEGNPAVASENQPGERGWPLLRVVAWVFLLSRLFFFEIASLAYIYLPHAWVEAPEGTLPPSGSLLYHIFGGLWVHWDGLWYLSIATFGYQNRPTATAFFPLFPLAMKLLGGGVIGGIIVSLVSFLVALYFLGKLVTIDMGPKVAWFTLLALAFFPTAFYANAVYSESLFLMLATASLYFLRTRRYWYAGPIGALATLVTIYGALLVLPFLWVIYRSEGINIKKLMHVLWMPLGIISYMIFLIPRFGDPLVFDAAQKNWGRHFELFPITIYQAIVAGVHAFPSDFKFHQLFALGTPSLEPSNFFNLLFLAFAILIAALSIKRIPFYLWIYMVAALMIPVSFPAQTYPLMSMPRLVLEAFPVFIGMGSIMARIRWTRATYFTVSIAFAIVFTSLFATAHWVA